MAPSRPAVVVVEAAAGSEAEGGLLDVHPEQHPWFGRFPVGCDVIFCNVRIEQAHLLVDCRQPACNAPPEGATAYIGRRTRGVRNDVGAHMLLLG